MKAQLANSLLSLFPTSSFPGKDIFLLVAGVLGVLLIMPEVEGADTGCLGCLGLLEVGVDKLSPRAVGLAVGGGKSGMTDLGWGTRWTSPAIGWPGRLGREASILVPSKLLEWLRAGTLSEIADKDKSMNTIKYKNVNNTLGKIML